jgi:hypothetical protein
MKAQNAKRGVVKSARVQSRSKFLTTDQAYYFQHPFNILCKIFLIDLISFSNLRDIGLVPN